MYIEEITTAIANSTTKEREREKKKTKTKTTIPSITACSIKNITTATTILNIGGNERRKKLTKFYIKVVIYPNENYRH